MQVLTRINNISIFIRGMRAAREYLKQIRESKMEKESKIKTIIILFIAWQLFAFITIQLPVVFWFITIMNLFEFIQHLKREIKQTKERG